MFDLQMRNQQELAHLITMEMGKPLIESTGEIVYGGSFFQWFSGEARRIHGEVLQSPFPDKLMLSTREAAGIASIITPWNFPNAMVTRKLAAALAAGCTTIIRPSEDTPFSAIAIAKLAEEAGLPPGVVNVIPSDRSLAPVIGQKLCESPDVSVVSFTGSTIVGKQLLAWGASTVKRICLELGGNAPFIVFDSADADAAAAGCIASKFRNAGQTCVCANRIFVQKSIHDEFVAKLAVAMKKSLRVGRPQDAGVTVGPLVNNRAVHKVMQHVDDAVSKGAKILVGGKRIDDNYFEPTLIDGIKDDMRIMKEETFGPVAGIVTFDTEDQVLRMANATRVGLAGYFYSRDLSQVMRVSRRLKVGMIGVNDGIISCAEAPFGGVKESGLGREGSHHGVDEFLSIKYICMGGIKF
jgi:succinate-semialdehyde dehydrogenase